MDVNDAVEGPSQRQGRRLEQLGLLGKYVLRSIREHEVEVGGDDTNRPRFRIEPQQVPVQTGRLGDAAAAILAEDSCGNIVNEHISVLESAEEDVFGFVKASRLAGALGDRFCEGVELGE